MPKTKTIDGMSVTCASLEPADAYDLMPELAPVFGLALGAREVAKPGKAEAEAAPASTSAADAPTDAEDQAGAELAELDHDALSRLLANIGTTLGGGKLTELLIKLMRSTVIVAPSSTAAKGEKGTVTHRITDRNAFNLAFEGRMWSAFAVAAFAFEVTFGNFTDVVGRIPGVVRAR